MPQQQLAIGSIVDANGNPVAAKPPSGGGLAMGTIVDADGNPIAPKKPPAPTAADGFWTVVGHLSGGSGPLADMARGLYGAREAVNQVIEGNKDTPVDAARGLVETGTPSALAKALPALAARHGADPAGMAGEVITNALGESGHQLKQAYESARQGEGMEAVGHTLGAIPFVGPAAVKAGENIAAGKGWEGAGEAAGLLAQPFLAEAPKALAKPVYGASIRLSPTETTKYGFTNVRDAGLERGAPMTAATAEDPVPLAQAKAAKEQALRNSPTTAVPVAPIVAATEQRIAPAVAAEINAGVRTSPDVPVVSRFGGGQATLSPVELDAAKSVLDNRTDAARRAAATGKPITANTEAMKIASGESGDTLTSTMPPGQYRSMNRDIMNEVGIKRSAARATKENTVIPSMGDVVSGASTYWALHNPTAAIAVAGLKKLLGNPAVMSHAGILLNQIDPALLRAAMLANLTGENK
jgi:hypothetical protein